MIHECARCKIVFDIDHDEPKDCPECGTSSEYDDDDIRELAEQADFFGMESLTEEQQRIFFNK